MTTDQTLPPPLTRLKVGEPLSRLSCWLYIPRTVRRDVFISHAEEDGAAALALAEQLRQLQLTTWAYEEDAVPGVSYLTQIDAAIDDCRTFLLLASAHSINNHQIIREVEQAHERHKMIIAARLGMTHQQFVQSNAILRVACGTAVTLSVEVGDLSPVAKRIANALGPSVAPPTSPQVQSNIAVQSADPPRQGMKAPESQWSPVKAPQRLVQDEQPILSAPADRGEIQREGAARKLWPGLWIGLLGQTLWAAVVLFDLIQYGRMEAIINVNFGGTSPQLLFAMLFPLIGVACGIWLWLLLGKYLRTSDRALVGRPATIAIVLSALSFLLTHGFFNYWILPDPGAFNFVFLPGVSTYFVIVNCLFLVLEWRGLQTLRHGLAAAST